MYVTEKDYQVRQEQYLDLVRQAEQVRLVKACQKPKSGRERYGNAFRNWVVAHVDKLRNAPPRMVEHP